MLLNAVPNPAGKEVKLEPSPLNDVAVITPAFPNFILLPTSIKSSTSAYATLRPAECKSDVPVLKLDAEDIPVVLTWL